MRAFSVSERTAGRAVMVPAPGRATPARAETGDGPRHAMASLLREMRRLQSEAARLRARVAELEALADIDPLADVLNRRAFMREFQRMIAHARRYGGAVSLVYFDVDRLKAVNDFWGHEAGDAIIRHVAALLTARTRASDLVGRLGGDEFAVALAHADLEAARMRAAHLARAARDTPCDYEGRCVGISCSWGAAVMGPGDDARAIMARADIAMYRHKMAGRHRLCAV